MLLYVMVLVIEYWFPRNDLLCVGSAHTRILVFLSMFLLDKLTHMFLCH